MNSGVSEVNTNSKRIKTDLPSDKWKPLKDVQNIINQDGGPTNSLKSKQAKDNRNAAIHRLDEQSSFDDVKTYIEYLCETLPELMEEAIIDSTPEFVDHLAKKLRKDSSRHAFIFNKDTAELLYGKSDLSQRGYKHLRSILLRNNVHIPSYEVIRKYCKDLEVGDIKSFNHANSDCPCMGVHTDLIDTLQRIFSSDLYNKMNFLPEEKNEALCEFLKSKDPIMYQKFNPRNKTILLRETGDNFRGAARFPTEKTSFSLFNLLSFANNPYGQFISTLWRGSESRSMLDSHVSSHCKELKEAVLNGVDIIINEDIEHFNVVVFLIADLSFLKDIIGHTSPTSTYGCFLCKLPQKDWLSDTSKEAPEKSVKEMTVNGVKDVENLGKNPNKDS
ncbi:uncharacterized protein [Clytia hemisphaerica]|uniref:Uncharacterized protein n=1 Tax=Clytia hemisphaerica TaxID=252671 RepID=A0A7M6DQL2_9CNID